MESFRLILVNNAEPNNIKVYAKDYSEQYKKHFVVGMDDEMTYTSAFVSSEHHAFIKALMDFTPDHHEYWNLVSTNENVKGNTQHLYFKLDSEYKEFLRNYEGRGSYAEPGTSQEWGKLRFLGETIYIFEMLQCSGMSAVIGQYLADIFEDLCRINKDTAPRDFGDYLAMPLEERVYVKRGLDYDPNDPSKNQAEREAYVQSKPTFDDIIIAVHNKIPDAQLPKLYPHIINKDPNDMTVYGPDILMTAEEMTPIVQGIQQYYEERQRQQE